MATSHWARCGPIRLLNGLQDSGAVVTTTVRGEARGKRLPDRGLERSVQRRQTAAWLFSMFSFFEFGLMGMFRRSQDNANSRRAVVGYIPVECGALAPDDLRIFEEKWKVLA